MSVASHLKEAHTGTNFDDPFRKFIIDTGRLIGEESDEEPVYTQTLYYRMVPGPRPYGIPSPTIHVFNWPVNNPYLKLKGVLAQYELYHWRNLSSLIGETSSLEKTTLSLEIPTLFTTGDTYSITGAYDAHSVAQDQQSIEKEQKNTTAINNHNQFDRHLVPHVYTYIHPGLKRK